MQTYAGELFIRRVQENLQDEPSDLTEHAARAAITELYTNWQAAVRDGTEPAKLVSDIDKTIELLRKFKAAIYE